MGALKKEVWSINAIGKGGIDATIDIAMGQDQNDNPAIRIGEHVFDGTIPDPLPEEGNVGDVLTKTEDGVAWEEIDIPDVDQTYDPESENAQSGIAVAQGIDAAVSPKYEKPENGIPKSDLESEVQESLAKADAAIPSDEKGEPNGVATLNDGGKIPAEQLPSYVDNVVEYPNRASFPAQGESGKIYVDESTNLTYRWSGTSYIEISQSLALGETASSAYRGDRGKIAYDHSQTTSGNPHNVNKTDVGLGNVDNTSDANKPISTATAAEFATVRSEVSTAIAGVQTAIANKANIDGYYEDMAVGAAKQLISPDGVLDTPENDAQNNPFIFRTSAGNQSITDGIAEIRKIRGKTSIVGGALMSVNPLSMKTIGFNAFNADTHTAYLLGGNQYQITGSFTSFSYSTGETLTPDASGIFTPTASGILTVSGHDTETCVHLVWSGYRNGETEAYWERSISPHISDYFPDGMNGVGNEYDELTPAKAVKRFEKRAYQSGDENLPNAITDKTNTVVKLSSAVETPIDPPLNFNYRVSDFGTEEWVYPELPFKGDLIKMDLNGDGTKETYRVLKSNGMICEILAMANASSSKFGSNQTYARSTLDSYLDNTWYNTLSETAKSAIVDKTFRQDSWYMSNSGNPKYSGYSGTSNPGTNAYTISLGNPSSGMEITRHVYALSVQDMLDYVLDTNITDGKLQNYNIWKMFWNRTTSISESPWLRSALASNSSRAFYVSGDDGGVGNYGATYSLGTRPALTIDLSMIPYEITEKTAKVRNVAIPCEIYYMSNLVDKIRTLRPMDSTEFADATSALR